MRLGIITKTSAYQNPVPMMLAVAIMLWISICAWHDLRRREVPDWLTLPAVGLGLVWRILYPDGWLPWALAGAAVALTLADVLPGGDMKGLAAMALFDPRLHLLAWVGAALTWFVWRMARRERAMPGYLGFAVGLLMWCFV